MGKQRRSWSVEEKLATVLAVLSERQSVAEVARQRGGERKPGLALARALSGKRLPRVKRREEPNG
ncbi:MAG TPA: hypothetical protein GX399_04030 [Xanthomonadaceae bacterium]|nr:hypothetical protein [Xanthomonadaceae bacterium]